MDKQKNPDCRKQKKDVENQKKDPMQNTYNQNFAKFTSSPIEPEMKSSKIKQRSLLQTNRVSPIKTPERSHSTAKEGIHKSKKENFSPLETSSPRIPQRLFAVNRIPLRTTISKPDPPHGYRNIQLSPTRTSSSQALSSKPKKIRKPINTDLFRPVNQTEKETKPRSTKENHLDQDKLVEDRSKFPEWEFIDWPWVTPYAPLIENFIPIDIKLMGIISFTKPEPRSTDCKPNGSEFSSLKKANEKITEKVNQGQDPPSLDKVSIGDQPKPNLYKIPPRRRELTLSDPIIQLSGCDPVVNSFNSKFTAPNEDTHVIHKLLKESLNLDENKPSFVRDISNFVKSITQMNEEDRRLMIGFLDLLNNLQSNENPWDTAHHREDENQQMKKPRSFKKSLNPDVPEFEPAPGINSQNFGQEVSSFQQRGIRHGSQRKTQSYNPRKEPFIRSTPITNILFELSSPHIGVQQNNSLNHVAQSESEAAYDIRDGSNGDVLLRACSNKLDTLESLIREIPVDDGNLPDHPHAYAIPTPQPPHLIVDSDEPGREANALENSWAQLMLKRYRVRFPKTGIEKEEKQTSVPTHNNLTVSELQQRIELYLLAKKEKEAYQRRLRAATGMF